MEQTCGNCRFFQLQDRNTGAGICRRYPPSVLAGQWATEETMALMKASPPMGSRPPTITQVSNIAGQNPPTTRDLWCGEWDEHYTKKEAN